MNSESEGLAYLDSVLVQKWVQRDSGYGTSSYLKMTVYEGRNILTVWKIGLLNEFVAFNL